MPRFVTDGIANGIFTNTEGQYSAIAGGVDGTQIWGDELIATAPHGRHVWTREGSLRIHH